MQCERLHIICTELQAIMLLALDSLPRVVGRGAFLAEIRRPDYCNSDGASDLTLGFGLI